MENEIERLRANFIVDRILIEALIQTLPRDALERFAAATRVKLEHFTVRTINSPMPEAFAATQEDAAKAWLSVLSRLGV